VQSWNLSSRKEFIKRKDSKDYPLNIPKDPEGVYKRKGSWISWGKFIGYK